MRMLEEFDARPDALKQVGIDARESARKAGVAIVYMEAAYGDDIIREYPDGRRERLLKGQNGAVLPIPSRA